MDFELTEQQELLRKMVVEFVKKECPREYAREIDEKEEFPHQIWPKLAKVGLLGVAIPEEYGGSGGDIIDMTLVIKELSKGNGAVAFAYFLTVCFGGKSIGFYGTEEQKKLYLPRLATGELKFSLALTEPGGGTDILGSLTTSAKEEGGQFVVNGQKIFISGADVADYLITILRTGKREDKKAWGISVLIIDAQSPGIEIRPIKKIGIKAVHACQVFFDNVKVPKENILGEKDKGWYQLVSTLNNERIGVAAMAVGMGEAALEDAVQYAKERHAFGRPIGQFQSLQNYLVESATELRLAWLLTLQAAWLQSQGKRCDVEATMAKMYASEAAFKAASIGISVMGGYGFSMEYDMQRYFRDSKGFTFAPITNEMCRNYIAENLLDLPRSY